MEGPAPTSLLLGGFNAYLEAAYGSLGIPVADVAGAFHSNDFPLTGPLPLPVALICQWTWMCVPPPQGPNIHANAIGYGVIATAFLDVLSP